MADAGKIQDAYHYACMAAGLDCAFTGGRNTGHFVVGKVPSRTEWLKAAYASAKAGGLKLGCRANLPVRQAATVVDHIVTAAREAGIDAISGNLIAS